MKKLWKWLDGKKTTIGAALLLAWQGVQIVFPEALGDNLQDWIENILYLITGSGLAHKAIKSTKKNP